MTFTLLPRSTVFLVLVWSFGSQNLQAEVPDYVKEIKPILQERCFACHGALQQQGNLRLDSGKLMLTGGDSGPVIAPRQPAASLLLERITEAEEALRMPPEGEPLTAEQIQKLTAWIAAGAPYPEWDEPEPDPREHWAFQAVVRPSVPAVAEGAWGRNAIDAFIAARHAERKLTPQVEAPRTLLIRRLYLDLIGLPPTAEELAAITADPCEDWYERLVDRLLDDPRHGERWGRHWMDIWRYSDWWGLGSQLRNSQQHIWHWRDWIVESLNADLPYDQMLRLMLAGDELAPTDLKRLRATGFLARNYFIFNRHQWMDETVEHVGKAFLGLTLDCAKCHDHKYDPFSHQDYYRFRAFFEPYHVRMELVPGQADLGIDGIPRAFDALLEEPTYLFLRGDENRPDTSQPLLPAVPEVLAFRELAIEPLVLPPEASQPERRPGVFETYLKAAQAKVEAAEQKHLSSQTALAKAEQQAAELKQAAGTQKPEAVSTASAAEFVVRENFTTLDPARWQLFGGDWQLKPGELRQSQDGPQRAGLRWLQEAPADFDLTLRYTLLGGSRWRSVGVGFDVIDAGPPTAEPQHEQFVYLSGVADGSKVQGAYRQGGSTAYPADGRHALPVLLNREYTLRVQVRGQLVNATLNGEPVLAWRTPAPRRKGALQLTTFDALAVFHEVSIAPLPKDVPLREPATAPGTNPTTPEQAATLVSIAAAELRVAEQAVAVAQAELTSLQQRMDALRAAWQLSDAQASLTPEADETATVTPQSGLAEQAESTRKQAILSERELAVIQSRRAIAEAELQLLKAAAADKREQAEKDLQAARTALEKAEAAVLTDITAEARFTPIVGAQWSATRFRSSGADDPTLPFPTSSSGRRTALAEWITDPRHPLTARVAVNHLWSRHFGAPLVPTLFEFGRNGTPPTHPELLDWLAAEFVDNGWSMKHLHRLIVTSATYRLDSSAAGRTENLELDPENRFWWRRNPLRIESQLIRDSLLALAGKLDLTQGGPPVPSAQQNDSTRRSLYFFHSNNERNLFLTTFDEAPVKECYRREQSIVPQQALAMSNSRLVLDSAGPISQQILSDAQAATATGKENTTESAADETLDDTFIQLAFTLLLGLTPSEAELAASRQALAAWNGLPDVSPEQARTYFIWALLNHNDFVTIR